MTRLAAAALAAAGVLWVIKAGVILASGWQPPLALELGLVSSAVGIVGLCAGLGQHGSFLARIGTVIAGLSLLAQLGVWVYELLPGAEQSTGMDFVFPYSLLVLVAAAGIFTGLAIFGVAYFRSVRGGRRIVPLLAAIVPVPAALMAIIHIEWPVLIIGLAWAAAGVSVLYSLRGATSPYEEHRE